MIFGRALYWTRRAALVPQACLAVEVAAIRIEGRTTAPHSPRQNLYVDRIVGSVRRESLEHVIILGEGHLRRVLADYFGYHNPHRAHHGLSGDDAAAVLEAVRKQRGAAPRSIRAGNGPEFVLNSLVWWSYFSNVTLDFSRPGKPTCNSR
ncbi:integrase core domain-containing protein [Posidoniimonas corsicana]